MNRPCEASPRRLRRRARQLIQRTRSRPAASTATRRARSNVQSAKSLGSSRCSARESPRTVSTPSSPRRRQPRVLQSELCALSPPASLRLAQLTRPNPQGPSISRSTRSLPQRSQASPNLCHSPLLSALTNHRWRTQPFPKLQVFGRAQTALSALPDAQGSRPHTPSRLCRGRCARSLHYTRV